MHASFDSGIKFKKSIFFFRITKRWNKSPVFVLKNLNSKCDFGAFVIY